VVLADPAEGLSTEEAGRLQERLAVLMRARRFESALPLAEAMIREFPNNPVYLQRLAEIQGGLGHPREEAEAWERFLKVSPTPGEAFPALGNAYRRLGQVSQAIHASERAVALEPSNPEFLFNLGRSYEYAKLFPKALETYKRACAQNPGDQDAAVGWARMEVFLGDATAASRRVGQVLARHPDNVDALLVQGMALRSLGQYDRAKVSLEQGLKLSPGYGDFMLVLGGIAEAQNRPAEALAWYDRYLAQIGEDAAVRAKRNRIAAQERK
jgi:protein O-GlcNAc transferase